MQYSEEFLEKTLDYILEQVEELEPNFDHELDYEFAIDGFNVFAELTYRINFKYDEDGGSEFCGAKISYLSLEIEGEPMKNEDLKVLTKWINSKL